MKLTLVVGPPNSGRAGVIRERFTAALPAQPILVVPTGDDVARFERELTEREGTVLGGTVSSFDRLFGTVAAVTGCDTRPVLSPAQRRRLISCATADTELGPLRGTSRHPGFVAGLDQLFTDLQTGGVDPGAGVPALATEDGRGTDPDREYLEEILRLLGAYAELRDREGWTDPHRLAEQATTQLEAAPELWGSRPVLFYGFDDLDPLQLRLVAALARAAEVTVAVSFEDRPAMAARATLHARLSALGETETITLPPNREHTDSPALFHIERSFGEPEFERAPAEDSVELLESGGARSEVEQIVAGVGEAIAGGIDPGEIAIVLRSPDRYATLYRDALTRAGIPHAVHGSLPIGATAVGQAILALIRAAGEHGTIDDLLCFLRYPGLVAPRKVDWLERHARRGRITDIDTAIAEHWDGRELWELDRLRSATTPAAVCEAVATSARDIAAWRLNGQEPRVDPTTLIELRAADRIAAAALELAELGESAPGLEELGSILAEGDVQLHRASAVGRVQVLSPYRIRAGRFSHVFAGALQEGEFPAAGSGSPFLSDEQRARFGLAARAEAEAEERYLFYVCLAAPTRKLVLSSRYADEQGKAESRSPFVEEVCELLAEEPPTRRREPGIVVPEAGRATHPRALARALAALPGGPDEAERAGESLDWPDPEMPALIARAADRARRPAPRDLSHPFVLERLGALAKAGASTLEGYTTCSYLWFGRHELSPRNITPDPEHMTQGTALHQTLEKLFREPPAGTRPTAENLPVWIERGRELLGEIAAEMGLAPDDANRRAGLAMMGAKLENYLRRESGRNWELQPDPELIEFSFGPDSEYRGPEIVDGFELRGMIDRVDVADLGDRRVGLIRDYKSGGTVSPLKSIREEGKLQLQLYAWALQHATGIEPLGGLYEPLGGKIDNPPRGIVDGEKVAGLVPTGDLVGPDYKGVDFEAEMEAGRELAAETVIAMRTGRIDRNPVGGRCPRWCEMQAICRRERSNPDAVGDDGGGSSGGGGS